MNVKLLRKVQKHILEEPKRLRMGSFLLIKARDDNQGGYFTHLGESWGEPIEQPVPKCGTVGCIAGWAAVLGTGKRPVEIGGGAIESTAADLLDLTDAQRHRLFFVGEAGDLEYAWPASFKKRYLKAKTAKTRAKIAAERIEHFIKTRGKK